MKLTHNLSIYLEMIYLLALSPPLDSATKKIVEEMEVKESDKNSDGS
jgi:hypothetical protein